MWQPVHANNANWRPASTSACFVCALAPSGAHPMHIATPVTVMDLLAFIDPPALRKSIRYLAAAFPSASSKRPPPQTRD
jgi:hypothetical protein